MSPWTWGGDGAPAEVPLERRPAYEGRVDSWEAWAERAVRETAYTKLTDLRLL